MYQFGSRIRYTECDKDKMLTFPALLDYFQDCSIFQSEDSGVGIDYLTEEHVAWVLSSWQIVMKRKPGLGENVKVATWPYAFERFLGYRNFTMTDEKGEVIAYANSVWVFLDTEKGRPTRITEHMLNAYGDGKKYEEPYPMECASRKIRIPEERTESEPFKVLKSHIDTNNHVNNGKYVRMAEELLPEGFEYRQMRAEYMKAAVLGDMIYPSLKTEEDCITVVLADENRKAFAVVEFLKEQDELC